jgi:precorrin-6Y C5,15-methyltransferase (decarboxylating)
VDVRVVPGEAPGALGALPDPDAVFVGGGGPAVIEAVAARHPARIVTALAAVERTGPAHAALSAAGYAVHGALVQAARFAPLSGDVHRLAATNPVFLLWATAGQAPGPGTTERAAGPGTTEPVSLGSAGHGPGLPGAPR